MDGSDDEFDMDFDMTEVLAVMDQVESRARTTTHLNGNNNHNGTTSDKNTTFDLEDYEFDDDIDIEALVQAEEAVIQQEAANRSNQVQSSLSAYYGNASTSKTPQPNSSRSTELNNTNNATNVTTRPANARITFGMPEDMEDPTPPPPPSADAKTFHPFDSATLPTWIYPTNHPIRGYQFNIVRKALFSNTLVSIPTGLGKTFIAAVVMYNYYRWFPNSIMIFMAPTRPLVEQQIKACHDVCGIPQKDTVMMVGTGGKVKRPELWAKGRIFFCTPQVVDNDLSSGICPAHKVVLLVIDEAHKATGNYAYTNVVERLGRIHSHFRILALSATPGSTVDKVQAVVNNLRINTVEVRTEESMDVQEFSFGKRVQNIVIKLNYTSGATGVVPQMAQSFCQQVFQPVLDRLQQRKAIYDSNVDRCSPFLLLSERKKYQVDAKNVPPAVKRIVTVDFLLAETLSRAYEALCVYGVDTFVDTLDRFLQSIRTDVEAGKNVPAAHYKILNHFGLKQMLDQSRQHLATPGFVGHPKLDSLLTIILRHFNECSEDQQQSNNDLITASSSSRIMVFSSLRASVNMIVHFLSAHDPLIKCAAFIGQAGDTQGAKGMSQREQQETIDRFKKGDINVMVATSIGEEGLDIGEVDLIVCYDSQSSSIRLLQRMGRTGRRRKGHCVMLMTEPEERKFKRATESYKYIQNAIAKQNVIDCSSETVSLLPPSYQPVVQRKRLAIGNYMTTMVQGLKRRRQDGNASDFQKDGTLSNQGMESLLATLPNGVSSLDQAYTQFWPAFHPLHLALKYLSLQRNQTPTKRVGHSHRTRQFTSLMDKMETRILTGPDGDRDSVRQLSRDNDADNNQVLKLPKRRKPTTSTTTRNAYDGIDVSAARSTFNNNNNNSNKSLILPLSKKLRISSPMTDAPENDAKQDSDRMKGIVGVTDESDWSSFMEPLMVKGMADDEDSYYQNYQSDYYQDDQDDNDLNIQSPSGKETNITSLDPDINTNGGGNSESPSVKATDITTLGLDTKTKGGDKSESPSMKATDITALDSETKNGDKQQTRLADKGTESLVPADASSSDEFDDDFADMDMDFWDNIEKQAMQNRQQGSILPPKRFLFDDDLGEVQQSDSLLAHSSTNFTTTFVWAKSKPVFSDRARQILIRRLQSSNNQCLAARLLGDQYGSGKLAKSMNASKSPGSQEWDDIDNIDFAKSDDLIGPSIEASSRTQLKCEESATSEQPAITDNSNSNNNVIENANMCMDNMAETSSLGWSITDSQPVLYEMDEILIPSPQQDSVNMKTTTEQEICVNNHQKNNDIPNESSSSPSNKPVEEMDCAADGDSMDSWEIHEDRLDDASKNGITITTPLEKDTNHMESPVTTPTAMEMPPKGLMHSTPQDQELLRRVGEADFGSRSQYLYSPTNNSIDNRSPLRLVLTPNKSEAKIAGASPINSLDGDSLDTPIMRRKRSRRGPIIRDSEDEASQNLANQVYDNSDTNQNDDETVQHAANRLSLVKNERYPSEPMIISSDDEEKDDQQHKNRTHHRSRQHRRSQHWVSNPFLDDEAALSDDGFDTGDEDEIEDASNVADSFIYDGSSELAPDNRVDGDSSSIKDTQEMDGGGTGSGSGSGKKSEGGINDMAMYRTSLLQRDVATTHGAPLVFASDFQRKSWLDKMEVKKWEYVADEDEDDVVDDGEVFHDASDIYSDAMLNDLTGDGISEDVSRFTNASDDFM